MPSFILDLFPDVIVNIFIEYIPNDGMADKQYLLKKVDNIPPIVSVEIYICKTYGLIFACSRKNKHLNIYKQYGDLDTFIDDYVEEEQIHTDGIMLVDGCPCNCDGIDSLSEIKIDNKQYIAILKRKLLKIE